jgi:hypothetical protein
MATIKVPNGFITLAESKAICHKCNKEISFEVLEKQWFKVKDRNIMYHTCECGTKMGIAVNMKGDYVSFKLKKDK